MSKYRKAALAAILMAAPLASCGQSGDKPAEETVAAPQAVEAAAGDAAEQAMQVAEEKTDQAAQAASATAATVGEAAKDAAK